MGRFSAVLLAVVISLSFCGQAKAQDVTRIGADLLFSEKIAVRPDSSKIAWRGEVRRFNDLKSYGAWLRGYEFADGKPAKSWVEDFSGSSVVLPFRDGQKEITAVPDEAGNFLVLFAQIGLSDKAEIGKHGVPRDARCYVCIGGRVLEAKMWYRRVKNEALNTIEPVFEGWGLIIPVEQLPQGFSAVAVREHFRSQDHDQTKLGPFSVGGAAVWGTGLDGNVLLVGPMCKSFRPCRAEYEAWRNRAVSLFHKTGTFPYEPLEPERVKQVQHVDAPNNAPPAAVTSGVGASEHSSVVHGDPAGTPPPPPQRPEPPSIAHPVVSGDATDYGSFTVRKVGSGKFQVTLGQDAQLWAYSDSSDTSRNGQKSSPAFQLVDRENDVELIDSHTLLLVSRKLSNLGQVFLEGGVR